MYKLYLWLIIVTISMGTISAQEKLSDKRPPQSKNKGAYQRYEQNDMGVFRKHVNYTKPQLVEEAAPPQDTINRFRKVEGFFTAKNKYYVDVNKNVAKMSEKRTIPTAEKTPPVVAETPSTTTTNPTVATVTHTKRSAPIKARGYRIQLFNGQDRDQANRVKNQFISLFPDVPRYLIFVEPTFRVRVGDFYTKADADNFLRDVKKIPAFSDAIVIRDIVIFKEPEDPTEEVPSPEN